MAKMIQEELKFELLKIMRERNNVQLTPQVCGLALMLLIVLSFIHLPVPLAEIFQAVQNKSCTF